MAFSDMLTVKDQDIYIIPAVFIPNLPKNIIKIDNWLPVIAYGSQFYMEKAFLAGCFDYLREPWQPEELFFRLDRILNKLNSKNDFSNLKIKKKTDDNHFSYQEIIILKTLLKQRGNPVNRNILFHVLWDNKLPPDKSRVIDVHVSNIKKKLKKLNLDIIISSVRGIGYVAF